MPAPSQVCRDFIAHASASRWREAVITLNGLNMYEMLRSLKALDAADIALFRAALTANAGAVHAPRIEYALTVVTTNVLPAVAPGDLAATGQVEDARQYIRTPRTILQELIPIREVAGHNTGLTGSGNALMERLFGAPRADYNQQCQPVTHRTLRGRIVTENVGPFNVTGLDSAVASLRTVMTNIQASQRLVYRVLGHVGMLCARNVRGSTTSISNHSWGTAIDLTIAGVLDTRGDNNVQFGLELIAPSFNAEGWFWGYGFRTEDGMHFEGGSALVATWATPATP